MVVFQADFWVSRMGALTGQNADHHEADDGSPLALSIRDSKVFADAFLNPKPVNDRLYDTIRRYREASGA
ncbi:MAG: hypothetical protein JWO51_3638 [Rhodospirillales bacterium]|nr:hypothetical protein [Rhodospirillales bacterium]